MATRRILGVLKLSEHVNAYATTLFLYKFVTVTMDLQQSAKSHGYLWRSLSLEAEQRSGSVSRTFEIPAARIEIHLA